MLPTELHTKLGDIIIAPPAIGHTALARTVILLTSQKLSGDFGLVINRPSSHSLADLNVELDCDLPPSVPLYWGGPVGTHTIWMLHTCDWSIDATVSVNAHWSMTSHRSMFHHLADGDCPQHFALTFGYCAWGPGQLTRELQGVTPYTVASSWLTWRQPASDVLTVPASQLWQVACKQSSHQAVASWMT